MNTMLLKLCLVWAAMMQVCFAGQFIDYAYAGRNNKLYVPTVSGYRPLPLFVMLHGCQQNPGDFSNGTNLNAHAEERGFFVVYPEQPVTSNFYNCWNWFMPSNQARGSGEPASIISIVQSVQANYSIDESNIYVGGLSAGAAMSVILGVTYPDVFRGVAVAAGLEYKASSSDNATLAVFAQFFGGPDPNVQGQVAYEAMGSYARAIKVFVTHGTVDPVVYPVNGQQVVASWAKTLDLVIGNGNSTGIITSTPTTNTTAQVPGGRSYTTYTYAASNSGATLIQYITVDGMGHAWSGGNSTGTFTDPLGPNASDIMVKYFLGTPIVHTTSTTSTTSTTTTTTTTTGSATTSPKSTTTTTAKATTGKVTSTSSSSTTTLSLALVVALFLFNL